MICGSAAVVVLALWALNLIGTEAAWLIVVSLIAGGTAMVREFFRITLFAFRRPLEVLHGDLTYVVLLIAGVFAATLTPQPALVASSDDGAARSMAVGLLQHPLEFR